MSRFRTYLDPCGLSHHLGDGPEVVERPLRRHARRAVGVREDAEVGSVFRCYGVGMAGEEGKVRFEINL